MRRGMLTDVVVVDVRRVSLPSPPLRCWLLAAPSFGDLFTMEWFIMESLFHHYEVRLNLIKL